MGEVARSGRRGHSDARNRPQSFTMTWSEMGDWWLTELERDSAYEEVVTPMFLDILSPEPGALYLDLGCGEGRVMRTMLDKGSHVHGVEMNQMLASRSSEVAPTVIAHLPDLPHFGTTPTTAPTASWSSSTCPTIEDSSQRQRGWFGLADP